MNYTDEESRIIYHGTHTTIQLICQILESHAFLYGMEPEFIDMIDEDTALLGIHDINDEQATELCAKVNQQFPRKDDAKTCSIFDNTLGLFAIRNADKSELLLS